MKIKKLVLALSLIVALNAGTVAFADTLPVSNDAVVASDIISPCRTSAIDPPAM